MIISLLHRFSVGIYVEHYINRLKKAKTKIKRIAIACVFFCPFIWKGSSVQVFAQAPQLMSYQAVVRNASNNLIVNTKISVRVSILKGSYPGNMEEFNQTLIIYVETHYTTTNFNGLATIQIGNGSVYLGNFATINWGSGPYFIKTEIDPLQN